MTPPPPVSPPDPPASSRPHALSIVGLSNRGKTTLICGLLQRLVRRGVKVAVLKHSHKTDLDPGDRGKDTWRYREAGALAVGLAAPGFLQVTKTGGGDPTLEEALAALGTGFDLILVEGYKSGPLPKIVVLGEDDPLPDYPEMVAVVCPRPLAAALPGFTPEEVEELARFVYARYAAP
jgi:molybdopterin-guanine dinucleotide biosynthesis protein MobB